ncbi:MULTISPECIES: DEAD/DEAH box helicase family protein [Pacificibacter]|uniref:DEAD/DEAH box helicase family protein n=1 Tax=Pacificibacter TaxID=1042323 RepID=UPI001C08B3F7|nr:MULTISPECIES: DEAD/DEAH box helicase family protein [Pacificibacter]MBU2937008.1 DEAD/DEAH box helicase family protein [Pacificibacter marinus]MDO6617184.1 DEAD/DEAH box helicase family protein [Pacificibacter sp. 1_MG-2023]
MVDFRSRLAGKTVVKPANPSDIYDSLDRAHDKGPLRPAQEGVLATWFSDLQGTKDVIVKLHTGQGKTLIGLLMLQSRLNQGLGPALYLCPDNYLIEQTCEQAKQFGVKTCKADGDLPDEFLNGTSILVTSVQKMFNGRTKFGLNSASISVGAVLMDDSHICSDRIRDACRIRIPKDEPAYAALKTLFSTDLEAQGVGTYAEIENGARDSILPVPYWAISGRNAEIAKILAANVERKSIKFAWPLLKNILNHCQYMISGEAIEIEPHLAPLEAFGSFHNAKQRIFMSATVTDDSFLIKGLQLKPETIASPLVYDKETWSGEKMILLPSLIDESLRRADIVQAYAGKNANRGSGVVALSPSFAQSKDWKSYGSLVADKDTLAGSVQTLKQGKYEQTVVLVNRYDGIDLPDNSCRILIFDSKPFSENLSDVYQESCRPNSEATLMRTIRSIEQGLGRSVRGEKDYSVIIVVGPELVRLVRDPATKKYLSPQMSMQIEIGLQISSWAKDDISQGDAPNEALNGLINQCLIRNDGWKAYYIDNMKNISTKSADLNTLKRFEVELQAEQLAMLGRGGEASEKIQTMLDSGKVSAEDKGWYLQERARYLYEFDRIEAQNLQVAAHSKDRLLLKPTSGVTVSKLTVVSHGRVERIIDWVQQKGNYNDLDIAVSDICSRLAFGVKADKFEGALDELSRALGFAGERPDKEWKEGPDNLWALDTQTYLLVECKNEVDVLRAEINKRETEQMNRSCAWFEKHYKGMSVKRLIIHPAGKLESAAALTHEVEGVREADLKRLVTAVRDFFKSFQSQNFADLSSTRVQKMLNFYKLTVTDLTSDSVNNSYTRKLKDVAR